MGKLSMELYLEKIRAKYKKANKREKGVILDDFCEHSGYHKKLAWGILPNVIMIALLEVIMGLGRARLIYS